MGKKRLSKVRTDTITNLDEDGNVVGRTEVRRQIHTASERGFVKLFIGDMCNDDGELLVDAPFNLRLALLILEQLDYDGKVDLSPVWRKRIVEKHMTKQTFYVNLKSMREWGFIRKCPDGRFMINPRIIGKGSAMDIAKQQDEWNRLGEKGA